MRSEEVPRLRNSIASLSVLQASNYLVPLITLPYLTRVLGPTGFGAVAYVQAIMVSLTLLADYAFSWSGTREIAASRNDRAVVSRVFRANWGAQWLLTAGAGGVLALGLWIAETNANDRLLHAVGFGAVIANTMCPIWLFQGLERMPQIAWLQVSARLATIPLIFVFVKAEDDAWVVLVIQSAVGVVAGAGALLMMTFQRWVDWQWPSGTEVARALKEGLSLFSSRLAIGCYTFLVPVILGAAAGTTAVAYFSLADKVRAAAQSLLTPIAQALYPRLSHLYATDVGAAQDLARRALSLTVLVAGAASLLLVILAEPLMGLLGGPGYEDSVAVLHLMALLPLVIGLSNVFGVQIMLPNRQTRPFNFIVGTAAVLGLVVVWPLAAYKGAEGAAGAMLFVELFVTVAMGLYVFRKPKLWRRT